MSTAFTNIYFLNAFLAGLFGSFHCLGMCGPLLLALPFRKNNNNNSKFTVFFNALKYHSGRILVYTFFGLILGIVGLSLGIAGIQNYVAIAIGIALIIGVFFPVKNYLYQFFNLFYKQLGSNLKSIISKNSKPGYFILGVFNGMLPCGLVYLALSGSLAAETSVEGAMFMLLFGLGTLPMMLAVFFIGFSINESLRKKFSKASTAFIIVFSIILIARGIYFEYQNHQQKAVIECHP
jgi:uncharacterized protein